MDNHPILTKAPIVEGLIDLRVRTAPEFSTDGFLTLRDALRERYPDCQEARRVETMIQLEGDAGSSHSVKAKKVGYRFESADKKFVLQAQAGGFTLSRLAPYESWSGLVGEARELWRSFTEVAVPSAVTRVAVRYINRIELPLPFKEFEEYLRAAPAPPSNVPQVVSEFLSRVVVFDQETGASIVVTQAMEPPDTGRNVLPLILDIDVFKEGSFDSGGEAHWTLLDRLRMLKNNAFFGSLTDKTLDLFR